MYHVSKPVKSIEVVAAVSTDLLVIDTVVSMQGKSVFEGRREDTDELHDVVDYNLVMVPTRQAILDVIGLFGYKGAVLAPPTAGGERMDDFEAGSPSVHVLEADTVTRSRGRLSGPAEGCGDNPTRSTGSSEGGETHASAIRSG